MVADLTDLHKRAHPNSAFARKYPHGVKLEDLPNHDLDRTAKDAKVNTGFPDDYPDRDDPTAKWDKP